VRASEQGARDQAMANAIKQFVRFCGIEVSIFDEYLKKTNGRTSGILSGELSNQEIEYQKAQAFVRGIRAKEWYLKKLKTFHDDVPINTAWRVSVLVMVPAEEKTRIQKYAETLEKEKNNNLAVDVNFYYESSGRLQELKNGTSLRSKTDFYYVYFRPEKDCYIYIYQVDSSGAVYQLFPNKKYSAESNPLRAQASYYIPENNRFYLDDVLGKEQLYLIASKKPAPKVEKLFSEMKSAYSSVSRRKIEDNVRKSLSNMSKTRGIGGVKQGREHNVKASNGKIFKFLSSRLASNNADFIYGINFMHID